MKSAVHRGVAHGLPTLFLRRAAAHGDLQAQLIRVESLGSDNEVFDPGARRRETRILRGFETLPATLRR